MDRINGKTVWITGASSGIGEALTYALSKKDCKLIISSRRIKELEKVKSNCKRQENIFVLPLDLSKLDKLALNAQEAISAFGQIDILVNNAGISQRSLIIDTDLEVFEKLIHTNYLGTVALSKAVLPYFVKRKKGHFVTVSSLMGKFGFPYRSGYCGAKHALHGFFDVLRMEHQKDNIQVTLICPGFVSTSLAQNALTADGSTQNRNDNAIQNGLSVEIFAQKMISAIECHKFEAYIGRKERFAVFLKRFFPKLLHQVVLKSEVK